ncbi:RmlC-like cupin domain-containing protein [Podospora didyma]|uniref:RmlC-like cupin domain-containing protein n=1 Tax=Podospora didyma TaxID=330526 RepID=A0AAE0NQT8_9PEZI|nr:RmlC-like cupin domain-containing protein [Podospora didyma]
MLSKAISTSTAAILALSSLAAAVPQMMAGRSTPSLSSQLRQVDSAADRYPLLRDIDFVFNFTEHEPMMANGKNFPALVGSGTAMAVAEIGPCGMAGLHVHPRSPELFIVIKGRVYTEMVPESGVFSDSKGTQRVIRTELRPYQMTLFPMGSVHMQFNPDCVPSLTIASFTSEDPGVSLLVPEIFSLPTDFIANSLGGTIAGADIDHLKGIIPQAAIFNVEQCLKKCNIQKRAVEV